MRIAICEDEKCHADILFDIITDWRAKRNCFADVELFSSAELFLLQPPTHPPFDLIFLDIQMDQISGVELAQTIRQKDKFMLIVFTTGISDYFTEGYDVNALQYLVKPLDREKCMAVLDRAKNIYDDRKNKPFVILDSKECIRLPFNDIYFFESSAHYIIAHTRSGVFRFRDNLHALEARLPRPQFCRCHRTTIVNIHYIYHIRHNHLDLFDPENTSLPCSKTYWHAVNHAFAAYHSRL